MKQSPAAADPRIARILDLFVAVVIDELERRLPAASPSRPPSPSPSAPIPPQLLTIVQAARVLGISRSKTYELVARGELPMVRFGRTVRIRATTLNDFIAEHAR